MSDLIKRLRRTWLPGDDPWEAADEIERLNCALTISRGKHENAIREIERLKESLEIEQNAYDLLAKDHAKLQEVVDAVKDIKWRSIDKDNMEFATTCFVVDRIREALAALEEANDAAICEACCDALESD